MTDLVVTSLESWDAVWRRNQHLVSRLLTRDHALRVLFVEPAADPLHDVRRGVGFHRGAGLRSGDLRGAEGRLWLFQPTKWLPRRLDRRTDDRLTTSVMRAARKLSMTRPVLWVNDPSSASLLRATGWPSLYDITDDWLVAERSQREHDRLVEDELFLLENSLQVVVCSPRLLETKRARQVTLIPNAVDVDAYREEVVRPADLPSGPVVLYLGTLHRDRLDVELCVDLATSLHGVATFVLIGPVALGGTDKARLTAAGAVLLGPRAYASVPAYLKNADVLVVPHVVTEFTDSLDPIKVYEYLASARPTVSTPVAGFRELFADQVAVVPVDRFVDRTVEIIRSPPPYSPPGVEVPTWDMRADAMGAVVQELTRTAGGPHG